MYITDLITLPRFCFGRGVYARFPALCCELGKSFVVVGGVTAMEKGLPSLVAALSSSDMTLLGALPFGGACTQSAMNRLADEIAPIAPDFIVGMGGGKAIDTAKGVADLLKKPLVSLPTLVSNCAPITALSVVYREDGPFDRFIFFDAPPALTLVDLEIAANAPDKYFRAGMGDTLAKHLESTFSARGDVLGKGMDHMSAIGVALSSTCYGPILQYGREALDEVLRHEAGSAMEICARSIIVSAGLVSLMANDDYNCALAHAVCYGLQLFEHVERDCLHGDLVAYGALVQLMLDGQTDKAKELQRFLKSLGTPVTLREMNVPLERKALESTLIEATTGPDMAHIPYPITPDMVFDAMTRVESL
ncbi:MAG: iron-containing alcohol dehydrogenase family protein [Clostridiales bacterium]|nr:iron-containing alcohol dehydrogenase family protein [Clostridiales bacterium]